MSKVAQPPDNESLPNEPMLHFSSSPFYKEGEECLPSRDQVGAGGIYMMDDAGGVVFQLFTSEAQGTINFEGGKPARTAMVHAVSGETIQATSYKTDQAAKERVNTTLNQGFTIIHLIKVSPERRPLNNNCRFTVDIVDQTRTPTGASFDLYNIHDLNGQMPIIHTEPPDCVVGATTTYVHGLIYVQHNLKDNGGKVVYMGYLQEVPISMDDSAGHFCD